MPLVLYFHFTNCHGGYPSDGLEERTREKRDLTSNNITKLTEDDLQQFTLLEELILTDNKLDSVHPKALSGNLQLKRL
ncbi:leucine-rich repeat-containing G-protein coupled receptor 4-like [Photinus pyralis]|uniref:leucine-rich repeat-containing G-protein coupled receptor 4-like n=1 Tax=Photinus pyralis TaxID=7054 RepID=UPI001266FA61|nr:leucine-rich repeat-containing G-protein coupled receptor 4-like [Photinus pyralis]